MSHGEFGAGYWEDRYRGGQGIGRHAPSPSLVAEVADLATGRALDAGCGRGADALWLAARGWQVTAVDISATAVASGRAQEAAGIAWVEADLTTWEPDGPPYDLVTSHFVHVPGPMSDLIARLGSWVAPGGTLLVVGHPHGEDGHPEAAQLAAEQATSVLKADSWDNVVAGPRTCEVQGPDGLVARRDTVVRARRRTT